MTRSLFRFSTSKRTASAWQLSGVQLLNTRLEGAFIIRVRHGLWVSSGSSLERMKDHHRAHDWPILGENLPADWVHADAIPGAARGARPYEQCQQKISHRPPRARP